jgi:ribosomal-protein-alanine N-acetyltransferase
MRKSLSEGEEKERSFKVRTISFSDLGRLFEIERASFSSPWTMEALRTQIAAPFSLNLLIEVNGEVAGYIMSLIVSNECHILNFAIDPGFRKRGYGSELLGSTLSILKKRDVKHVFLEVRERNLPAIHLYLKSGFKIIGKRKRYYEDSGEDALIMHLEL